MGLISHRLSDPIWSGVLARAWQSPYGKARTKPLPKHQETAIAFAFMRARVAAVGTAVTEEIDSRERALEFGVRYAGERVTVRPSGRVKNRKIHIEKK